MNCASTVKCTLANLKPRRSSSSWKTFQGPSEKSSALSLRKFKRIASLCSFQRTGFLRRTGSRVFFCSFDCLGSMLKDSPAKMEEKEMSTTAKLILDGKTYEFPVIIGTEGEKAIDISTLRQQTGFITYDRDSPTRARARAASPLWTVKKGFSVTGATRWRSLRSIRPLWRQPICSSTRAAEPQRTDPVFRDAHDHSLVHEDMREFFQNFPRRAILWASCPQW